MDIKGNTTNSQYIHCSKQKRITKEALKNLSLRDDIIITKAVKGGAEITIVVGWVITKILQIVTEA